MAKDKTGVAIKGIRAVNPVNGQGDSHLGFRLCSDDLRHRRDYGRARPRHERDWEFAKKFGLPIIEVVSGRTER